jgi:endonuclease/exonuclease/phosphatase family metal-dependent hydrolase
MWNSIAKTDFMKPTNLFPRLFLALSCFLFALNFNAIAQELTVMTYNIYHGELNYEPGKSNLKEIADIINQYKPDFVAMQEVDSMTNRSAAFNDSIPQNLVQELAELTGMYGFFGKAIDYSNGGYGEGILSRFPTSATKSILPIPKGGEHRAFLSVEHTFPNGQKIIFAGTHLCHEFAENRLAQAETICSILKDSKIPIVMGGDFNFRTDSEPYKVIRNCFNDAADIKGDPQNTIPFENPRARIDYIFLSKKHDWTVKDVKVIRVNASDHMPVLVTLELNK